MFSPRLVKRIVDLNIRWIQGHIFTDPKEVNPSRGLDKYLVIDGAGKCIGLDLSSKVISPHF